MTIVSAVVLLALAAWVLARRRYLSVTVQGRSMAPTYEPGDRVLARRTATARLRLGDVVVLRDPAAAENLLIKRVAALPGDEVPAGIPAAHQIVPVGALLVLGDNPLPGNDSRHFGLIPAALVLAVARQKS